MSENRSSELSHLDNEGDESFDTNVETEVEENVDSDAGYDHDAASEIQTALASLENSSVEIAERVTEVRAETAE